MTDSPLFQDGQRQEIKSASLVEFHPKEALEDPDEGKSRQLQPSDSQQ